MTTTKLERSQLDRALTRPLYRQVDVARIIAAETSTVHNWARGYVTSTGVAQPPVLTGVNAGQGYTVSFLALTEAFVLNIFRKSGLPLQRIRPAVAVLKETIGIDYALASERLVHDGADILLKSDDPLDDRLIVVRNRNAVFNEVVTDYLKQIDFGPLGYAARIRLPQFTDADITVDPRLNGGRPTIASRGVAIDDVLSRIRAGEPLRAVAEDYGVDAAELLYLHRAVA